MGGPADEGCIVNVGPFGMMLLLAAFSSNNVHEFPSLFKRLKFERPLQPHTITRQPPLATFRARQSFQRFLQGRDIGARGEVGLYG